VSQQRVRRSRDEARRLILEAAERLLVEGGPAAVQVRAVAERVGMTDAGVYHHFGTQQSLLVALLRHGGRRLRQAVEEAASGWAGSDDDVRSLVVAIATLYAEGYAELAIALHAAGWSDPGGGLLEPVVQALQAARERAGSHPDIDETRLAVAALHQALALEPVYGRAFRRSAGISARAARDSRPQLDWWTRTLRQSLGLKPD
jgi:AcrR family transcriptional regulator